MTAAENALMRELTRVDMPEKPLFLDGAGANRQLICPDETNWTIGTHERTFHDTDVTLAFRLGQETSR
jgi:hypothetical protein